MSAIISQESANMVTQMAEEIILDKGAAFAREVKLYLETHPGLKKENFNKTPEFVEIVIQKVGKTDFTLLVERETASPPEYMWVHPNEKLVGIDITDATRQIVIFMIGITTLLVAAITIFYGQKLTSKILTLTNIADRISLGDMDARIESTGKDELGDPGQAIYRMQYSIRVAIDRLRAEQGRPAI